MAGSLVPTMRMAGSLVPTMRMVGSLVPARGTTTCLAYFKRLWEVASTTSLVPARGTTTCLPDMYGFKS